MRSVSLPFFPWAVAACALLLFGSPRAHAQLQWDPLLTPTTPSGGPGSWTNSAANWSDGANDVVWNSLTAVFGGPAGGTVTLDSTGLSVTGLTFNTTGYTLASGVGTSLNLVGATNIIVASGAQADITTVLAGTGSSITYNSAGGILALRATNTFTGGFNLQAGTVLVNANNALGATAGVVTISGGVLGTFDTTARTLPNPIAITGSASFQPLLASGNGLLFSSNSNTIANNPTLTFDGAGSLTIWSGRVTLSSNFTTAGTRGFGFTGGLTNTGGVNRVFTINSSSTSSVIRNSLIGFDTNTITFEGTGAVGLSGGTAPHLSGATAGVIINGPIIIANGTGANTFTGGVTLISGQVRIAASSASLTSGPLGNGTFTINGGTTRTNDGTARSFSQPIVISGDAAFGGGGATLTFTSDSQSIVGDRVLTFSGNATAFLPATAGTAISLGGDLTLLSLSGTGPQFGALNFGGAPRDIIKSSGTGTPGGTATFTQAAQNIVAGNTLTINTGVVALANGDALGSGVTSLTIAPTTTTSNGVFSMTGTGTVFTGAGDLLLGGTSTAASQVTIAANTFNLSGNVVFNGAANPAQALISSTGATGTQGLNLGAVDRTFNVSDSTATAIASSDLSVTALLQGSGGLIKTGNGMLGLGAANLTTYTGAITINDGRVLVSVDGALGDTLAGTTVNNGGTLSLITASYLNAEPLTLNGPGFNGVSIGLTQRAALETATATSLTWAGPITLGSNATIGNSQTGGTFTLTGGINTNGFTVNFVGTRTAATPDGIQLTTAGITGTGGVQKDGLFDLGFNVANTYSGATVVNQGRLVVRDAGALGTSTITVNSTGGVAATSGTVSFNGTYTIPNNFVINGPGFTGRMALDMTTSGTTTLSGLITLGSDAAIGANASTLKLIVSNQIETAGFTLRVAGIGPTEIPGIITGTGGLTKSDGNVASSSTLLLGGGVLDTAPNTYTGLTTIAGASGTSSVTLDKAPGTTVIAGDVTILSGTLNGLQSEQIADTATVTVSGGTFGSTAVTTKIETIANLAQSGGVVNNGQGGTLNVTNAALITGGLLTPNSGGFANFFLLSVTTPGAVQLNGNSTTTMSVITVGLGGLSLDGATIITNQSGTGTTMGTRFVLQGNVNSTGVSAVDRSGGGSAVSSIDLNGGTRTFNVTAGTLTLGAPVENGGVTKTGGGVLNLNAVNTFTGPLDVSFGRVNVGTVAAASVAAGPVLSVSANGTLGGIGTINRGSSISGTLAPGTSVGELTVTATQTWNPGGVYQFEYDAAAVSPAPTTTSDHLLGTGAATLDLTGLSTSNKFVFSLVAVGVAGASPVDYTVATFPLAGIIPPAGMIGNDLTPFFAFTGDFAGTPTATLVSGDSIVLNFTPSNAPIPEPALLLVVAMGGVLAVRRRK